MESEAYKSPKGAPRSAGMGNRCQIVTRNSRQANNNMLNCNKGSINDVTGSPTTAKNKEEFNCQLNSSKGSIGNVTGSSTTAKKKINGYTNLSENNGRRQGRDRIVFDDESNVRLRRRQQRTDCGGINKRSRMQIVEPNNSPVQRKIVSRVE